MDINRAKEEIKNTVRAYLAKDEDGAYRIPSVRQRPLLLMGPPGIGKTAIMEQAADECGIALVAYTITHHTRQSAIGLPFLSKREYGGKEYTVTEYTMSEIIASVYEKMETTGLREGILFLDEINCVSETLAPTMLQFLQKKSFGSHLVPEGWVIAAAGNPPEYNKSVRDFDIVTLDRVKRIDVEENLGVWKRYAYRRGLHPAILAYLDIKKQNFYSIETTADGPAFVTARGWEDLSSLMQTYERLDIPVDESVIAQYVQHPRIARDFAAYYDLFRKYRSDYPVEAILAGEHPAGAVERLRHAPFDERLSVIGLLLGRLSEDFSAIYYREMTLSHVFDALKSIQRDDHTVPAAELLERHAAQIQAALDTRQRAGTVERAEIAALRQAVRLLHDLRHDAAGLADFDAAFPVISDGFMRHSDELEQQTDRCAKALESAFDFLETALGKSQELVVFVTGLNTSVYATHFIEQNGSAAYARCNRELMITRQRRELLEDIRKVEGFLE